MARLTTAEKHEIVKKRAESPLSLTDFCRLHGISTGSLRRWQACGNAKHDSQQSVIKAKERFAEVTVDEEHSEGGGAGLDSRVIILKITALNGSVVEVSI